MNFDPTPAAITLDNCASEPIHIPGLVQPHGALVALNAQRRVTHVSANARVLLGNTVPQPGDTLNAMHLAGDPAVHGLLDALLDAHPTWDDGQADHVEVRLNGCLFDLIAHRSEGQIVAEFELRSKAPDAVADFAMKAHRAMDKLKRQNSIDALLVLAVGVVRQVTGFDRVMAYRFRHDDSGDVAAEDRDEALEPFVGRRYPASDIPAQARRLYLINTLRLISDVHAASVPLMAAPEAKQPLDMSHCVLRSVSPIHIEYLGNMGVEASMSVSIVVNGRLWGMLACHHREPLQVPYSVRMACDVLAQVLAANVQSLLDRDRVRRAENAAGLRARLIEAVLHADDPVPVLHAMSPQLAEAFDAPVVIVAQQARLHVHGALDRDAATAVLQWLKDIEPAGNALIDVSVVDDWPVDLAARMAPWCGLLALRFDELAEGWLVMLRKEQIETVLWGGQPEKVYANGPLGPRLTPRGSFDVWKETVRGTSVPWSPEEMEQATQLRDELVRAGAARLAEMNRARSHLLAMLGHDLRDPLQSIRMAAKVLELGGGDGDNRLSQRIESSSSRMARLIGQVLDASRLQHGSLQMNKVPVDVSKLLADVVDEARTAYPGVTMQLESPASLPMQADPDRIAQLFSNLISNARHHGTPGAPVIVRLSSENGGAQFDVRNEAPAIAEDIVPHLFNAFRRGPMQNARNKGGLGLGLHIAQAIVVGHGGEITYRHEAPHVVFTVRLPVVPSTGIEPVSES